MVTGSGVEFAILTITSPAAVSRTAETPNTRRSPDVLVVVDEFEPLT
jgi:hypothetical protein